ncbi:unannotated protein [freshwater metagenome]|uniref:Unannotated protein n=1 Tax=freshwater metagenome TaxID=449393 RepID=A0A6J7H056_9ZZZZ
MGVGFEEMTLRGVAEGVAAGAAEDVSDIAVAGSWLGRAGEVSDTSA